MPPRSRGNLNRRIARRRGKKRAVVAIGRSILVIIWALLSDTDAQFIDLGSDYYAGAWKALKHFVDRVQAGLGDVLLVDEHDRRILRQRVATNARTRDHDIAL